MLISIFAQLSLYQTSQLPASMQKKDLPQGSDLKASCCMKWQLAQLRRIHAHTYKATAKHESVKSGKAGERLCAMNWACIRIISKFLSFIIMACGSFERENWKNAWHQAILKGRIWIHISGGGRCGRLGRDESFAALL
jgi:hypothetical protein